jgi:hypothetical protein
MTNFKSFCTRGLLSVFLSRAMENLDGEINAVFPGSDTVTDHGWWFSYFSNVPWMVQQCIAWHVARKKIVLIGHSFGGTACIMVNAQLASMEIDVDLLCPIDPAVQYSTVITPNAKRIVGFYQTTPGNLGQGRDAEGAGWTPEEWAARQVDYHFAPPETHLQIADEPFVHTTIIQEIRKVAGAQSGSLTDAKALPPYWSQGRGY